MVNTVGLRKAAVLETLAKAAGVGFNATFLTGTSRTAGPNCFWPTVSSV